MSKKLIFFFVGLIFFSSCHLAYASLTINEIMYDLSGADSTNSKSREWIEIYNGDASDVAIDAGTWRIYDGSANRTINGQVNFSIPSHAYVIFAGNKDTFLADHAGFSGTVYDTGITSLNNTSATLKLLDQNGNAVDSVAYTSSQGGAGDGNSLQKVSGAWVGKAPTPGATNEISATSIAMGPLVSGNGDNDNSSIQNKASAETKNKTLEEPKIKTQIIAKNSVFVGTSIQFQAIAFGYGKEKLQFGKYFWNFGDGDFKEIKNNSTEKLTHSFPYPGDYIVSLEYYMNPYGDTPDASDKMKITVIPVDILISKVGDEKDFFVELANDTDYDADISGWSLSSSAKIFSFPRNTVISSKKKMTISGNLTHFGMENKETLKLIASQGKIVFDYGASLIPTAPVPIEPVKEIEVEKIPEKLEKPTEKKDESLKQDIEIKTLSPEIPAPNLEASVIASDAKENNSNNSYLPMIISTVFIGASASAVYFIRSRRMVSKLGDDFKILDE